MKFFTTYDVFGKFGKVLGGDEQQAIDNTPEGWFFCEGIYDASSSYFDFDTDEAATKKEIDIFYSSEIPADGATKAVIRVPEYTGVNVVGPSGIEWPLDDDEIHYATPEPGVHVFVFSGVEHLEKRIEIYAT